MKFLITFFLVLFLFKSKAMTTLCNPKIKVMKKNKGTSYEITKRDESALTDEAQKEVIKSYHAQPSKLKSEKEDGISKDFHQYIQGLEKYNPNGDL